MQQTAALARDRDRLTACFMSPPDIESANDTSCLYRTRLDDSYGEVTRGEVVHEFASIARRPEIADSHFATVGAMSRRIASIGRVRLLPKGLCNCNSWHRDPRKTPAGAAAGRRHTRRRSFR